MTKPLHAALRRSEALRFGTLARSLEPVSAAAAQLLTLTLLVAATDVETPSWERTLIAFVLGPTAAALVTALASAIGGRVHAVFAASAWLALPFLALWLFDFRYDENLTQRSLPELVGLRGHGLALGVLLLVGTLVAVRRGLPAVRAAGAVVAAGALVATLWGDAALDWAALRFTYYSLREYFWSAALLVWSVVAGTIGLARFSPADAAVVSAPVALVAALAGGATSAAPDGGFLVTIVPVLPLYAVVLGGVVLLVRGLVGVSPVARRRPT